MLHGSLEQNNSAMMATSFVFSFGAEILDEIKLIQDSLKCALSKEIFDEPVVTQCCGGVFNQGELQEWLDAHPKECPLCDVKCDGYKKIPAVSSLLDQLELTKSVLLRSGQKEINLQKTFQALSQKSIDAISSDLTCTISGMIFLQPVFSKECAHPYESESVLRWLENETTCSCCRGQIKQATLYRIPLFDKLVGLLSKILVPVAQNQYFSQQQFSKALKQDNEAQLTPICQAFVRAPLQFNEVIDKGDMPPAFYLSRTPVGRKLFRETKHLKSALTKETLNMVSERDETEGESMAYWLSLECLDPKLEEPSFADKRLRDLLEPDLLGSVGSYKNPGITPLFVMMFSSVGTGWIIEDIEFRKKLNRFSLNYTPTVGPYRNNSPLLLMCFRASLRAMLYKDKFLQKNVGKAINNSSGDNNPLTNPAFLDVSPLLLMTVSFAEDTFDMRELLHESDIRAEITEEGLNRVSSNAIYDYKSPAVRLLTDPRGLVLLRRYADLRDKISVETLMAIVEWENPTKGATLLHLLVKYENTFELLNSAKNLQLKITLDSLLRICDDRRSNLYGTSPLSTILSKGILGWEFLIKLVRNNAALRSELITRFDIPKDFFDRPVVVIALYLYVAFLKMNDHLPGYSAELRDQYLSIFNKVLIDSISKYVMELLLENRGVGSLAIIFDAPLFALIQSTPRILNIASQNTSFLAFLLELTPGANFILNNPLLWNEVSIEALNCISQNKNKLGISAFFNLCILAIATKNANVFLPQTVEMLQPSTLYTISQCNKHRNNSPLQLMIFNLMPVLINNKNLREKIQVKDLLSFQCRDMQNGGELINYLSYLMRRAEGIKLIQMRVDDSEQFTNDMLSILTESSLETMKKSGINFEKRTQKVLDFQLTLKTGLYTIKDLRALCLVSKAIRSQVNPVLEEIKLLRLR
ncbi:MAG: hypothetical protein P4M14_10190 [Gammaproteobacteria bacterium]|nr:hypothetical protein [Gammaproteobacteria bacterium]